jgi:hypothetical protein
VPPEIEYAQAEGASIAYQTVGRGPLDLVFVPGFDLGADTHAGSGRIALATAQAVKQEARRRADTGLFFGHIAYASLVARRPE